MTSENEGFWESVNGSLLPYGRQTISTEDINSVVNVLHSDWLTQGPVTERFEVEFARRVGAKYAVAVSSATAALHLSSIVLGMAPGETLWTTPNTFVASANCALHCGGSVDFVDIDPSTYNLSVDKLEDKLQSMVKAGMRLPKIVVPVHFAGQPCDMEQISALAEKYRFSVLEDAAHAVGSYYRGNPVGDCHYSDMTVFSFHPVKIMTTGEGGMITTNNLEHYNRLIDLRSHGITRNPERFQFRSKGPWYYEQQELGSHYRMTDIQAALGLSQLNSLDKFIARREEVASSYDQLLAGSSFRLPVRDPKFKSSWHLYVARIEDEKKGNHHEFFQRVKACGVGIQLHYLPVHLHPFYRDLGFKEGDFPGAEKHANTAFSLPIFPTLKDSDIEKVAKILLDSICGL